MTLEYERTLLIVDDEPDILDAVERLLRKEYRVLTAQTPDEARAILAENAVQVVFSDQRMPNESGVEFLSGLRQSHPDVVRVLLTGYSNIDHVIDAINEGNVYRYVSKPWDPAEFRVLLEQCFEYWESRRERELLVEELQAANEKLEAQNALLNANNEALKTLDRMKTVFMEVVSHELNTPVAVILGYTFLLNRELSQLENEVVQKAIRGIGTSGERLKNISSRIFQMLASDAPDPNEMEDIDLREFFEEIREDVHPFLHKRSQRLVLNLPEGSHLRGDRAKLRDVFINLVMNAIKFSYDGQEIVIEARIEGGAVVTTVSDQGIGISEEDRAQVFDAFFSTFDSRYHSSGDFEFGKRGIGLGLSVARHFAAMHGGEISVESDRPGGSRFSVRLPQDAAESG